ncbi:hypothetical protein AB205_0059480 [Aquarana catesbeiana]|uniref:Uncharacterized protein n=1 Tax=Aquarana catesbeiana TaxID=8400 RepID=A0A2G9S8U9_AQUCT|nr:hypothetical protein AB205_0059480 [Aquarana catesbeiana]
MCLNLYFDMKVCANVPSQPGSLPLCSIFFPLNTSVITIYFGFLLGFQGIHEFVHRETFRNNGENKH